ncbi:MAG: IPT/TIG domain-containing protein, partial [Polyangiales bacterium]
DVPAGALSTDVILAIDIAAGAPPSGTLISPLVKVGPDGTLFAKPARLTLPWSTGLSSPQLAMLARIGFSWSSLIDPSGDPTAKTLTASMTRASGAGVIALDLTSVTPKITAASPKDAGAGTTIFLEGSGFGDAPVWRASADGGADFVSNVTIGGTAAKTLAWEDGAITVQGTTTGAIVVTTPGGSATAP